MKRPTPEMHNAFEASQDGYSFGRYGAEAWYANIRWLLSQGLNADQAAAVMNSKVTRWAADAAADQALGTAVYRYYASQKFPRQVLDRDVAEFTADL